MIQWMERRKQRELDEQGQWNEHMQICVRRMLLLLATLMIWSLNVFSMGSLAGAQTSLGGRC
ncbi:hypothetical protein BT96DRAFT_915528, partial [Gymnopus androsaceus JB14]